MKNKRRDSYNTGIASEYLILSYLYRLDLEAYLSQGNKKSVDIRVIKEDGRTLTIDVKSVRGYSSLVVNNVEPKENHFLVFVIYNEKFEKLNEAPEVFIVPSFRIPELVKHFSEQKRIMKGALVDFKDKWDYIRKDMPTKGENDLEEDIEDEILGRYFTLGSLRRETQWNDEKIADFMGISITELNETPSLFEKEMARRQSTKQDRCKISINRF